MNCHDVKPRLIELVYEELPAGERQGLAAHLDHCPACRSEHDALCGTRRLLSETDGEPMPSRVDAGRVLCLAARRAQGQRRIWKRWALIAVAAAVLLSVVVFGRLDVVVESNRLSLAWGGVPTEERKTFQEAPPASHVQHLEQRVESLNRRFAEQDRLLAAQASRLGELDELVRLATQELLDVDRRHVVNLSQLASRIEQIQKSMSAELKETRRQNDARWRLTLHEFSQRASLSEVVAIDAIQTGG